MDDKPTDKRGRCAICGEVQPLVLDHDHQTAKVRGLICTNCNHGIARFHDDPVRLEAAAAYLRNPPGVIGVTVYPHLSVVPEHLRRKRQHHTGCIRLRGDGRWESSLQLNGRRKSFYGKTRAEVEVKLVAFMQQCGLVSTMTA